MQRGAFVWGSVLILFGALMLLDRLGILSINPWTLFWPLLIIAAGLSFLLGGWGSGNNAVEADDQTGEALPVLTSERLIMELKGAETADLHFHFDGLLLRIDGASPPDELLNGLFTGGVTYEANDMGNGRVRLILRSPSDGQATATQREWHVSLNPNLPLALHFETMADAMVVNLRDMQVTDIALLSGPGSIEITFPAAAGYTRATFSAPGATTVMLLPEEVAASIHAAVDSGLIEVDRGRFLPLGDDYLSPDFDSAPNRVEISAEVGTGSLMVR